MTAFYPPGEWLARFIVIAAYLAAKRIGLVLGPTTERMRLEVHVYDRIGKRGFGAWEVRYGDTLVREGWWYEDREGRVYCRWCDHVAGCGGTWVYVHQRHRVHGEAVDVLTAPDYKRPPRAMGGL